MFDFDLIGWLIDKIKDLLFENLLGNLGIVLHFPMPRIHIPDRADCRWFRVHELFFLNNININFYIEIILIWKDPEKTIHLKMKFNFKN